MTALYACDGCGAAVADPLTHPDYCPAPPPVEEPSPELPGDWGDPQPADPLPCAECGATDHQTLLHGLEETTE